MKRLHQYSIREKEKIINNQTYNFNKDLDNNKSYSIYMKNNNSVNKIHKNKIELIKKVKNTSLYINNKSISNSLENSAQKISTSCEMSNNRYKNTSLINFYKESAKKHDEKILNKNRTERQNIAHKFSNMRNKKYYQIKKPNRAISSLRYHHSQEKVDNYFFDKNNFSKDIIKKKNFLDKYSKKDFSFLKKLLEIKSFLEEVENPIDNLELKKVKGDAETNFYAKLEIAKSDRRKKNLDNLIKQNINIEKNNKNKNYIENGSDTPSSQSENNYIDNKEKLKQIEKDYNNIITKRNILINSKKRLYNTSKSFCKKNNIIL